MKKILRIPLLFVALFLFSVPISAHDFEVDGIYYNITNKTNKTVAVTYRGSNSYDYSDEYSGAVTIPSKVTYNNTTYSVTEIGEYAFYNCTGLTSVTIPNSITSIGEGAFMACTGLTSVTIPNSVTEIGSSAFSGCTGLTSITIPNSVTSIGSFAFEGCTGLKEVNIADLSAWCKIEFDGVYANPLYYATKLKLNGSEITDLVIPNNITKIKDYAFSRCTGLTEVTIGNSVTVIGSNAFYKCTGLTSVTIPNSVTEIGSNAFYKCTGLTSVTIPNSVTEIGSSAFSGCTGLTSITIPNSVSEIGEYAFNGTAWYNNQPDGVVYINNVLYIYRGTMPSGTSIVIKDGTVSITPRAFRGCTGLTSVTIPNSVTSIGSYAFSGCTGLTKTTIEKGNDSISINSNEVLSCKKVYIGRPLKYINSDYATDYRLFNNVSELTIDCEIAELTDYMFKNCKNLKVLSVGKGDSELKIGYLEYSSDYYTNGKGLFYNLPLDSVYIGRPISYNATKQYGYSPFAGIKTLKHIVLDCNNMDVTLTSYFFEACDSIETISIQNSHQQMSLPAELFKGCANLKSLTLPFPGAGTAQTTSNFGELFGTESNSNMRAVTQFFEDGTKKTYYLPTGLEELVLTEGCEMIPYGGLYNCNMLKRLTLPTSLYMVGDKALYGCAQISDIYCKGADPAVAYDSSFDGMRLTSCKLHVPYNSSERYKISDGWKRFYYVEEEAPLVVSVAKNIENAGVVYGINEYQPGQVAEVEAVAHSGYTFVGWYENGNLLTTDSKYTIMVTDSHSLVAMFAPVLDENEVEVAPQDKNVTLSWAQETGATYYNIDIYSDATMIMQVGSMVVDNTGQPVSRSTAIVSATIDGLNEMQNYYYSISAIGEDDVVLSKYIGSFSTSAGINNIYYNDNATEVDRYDIYGHRLTEPTKGINIVKYSDGTTRKEFVK